MIRIFIMTYKRPKALHRNLESLFKSDITDYPHEIYIINNHSNFAMSDEYKDRVKVLHNVLRPDWSKGYMARNWNQALLLGFENLKNPAVPYVMHSQDDIVWQPKWCSYILKLHERFSFITFGGGDQLVSYTPEAVKKIGLWDEMFSAMGCHEGDYFLRAIIYNGTYSTINDVGHNRLWQPVDGNLMWNELGFRHGHHSVIGVPFHDDETQLPPSNWVGTSDTMKRMWYHKWGQIEDSQWDERFYSQLPSKPVGVSYIRYPFFELDVENLKEKGYLL